jgi:hypothetical protein
MDFVGGFIAVASDHHVSKKGTKGKSAKVLFVVALQVLFLRLTVAWLFPDASLTIPAELRFQLCSAATMSSAAISVIPHVEGCPLPCAALTYPR